MILARVQQQTIKVLKDIQRKINMEIDQSVALSDYAIVVSETILTTWKGLSVLEGSNAAFQVKEVAVKMSQEREILINLGDL